MLQIHNGTMYFGQGVGVTIRIKISPVGKIKTRLGLFLGSVPQRNSSGFVLIQVVGKFPTREESARHPTSLNASGNSQQPLMTLFYPSFRPKGRHGEAWFVG